MSVPSRVLVGALLALGTIVIVLFLQVREQRAGNAALLVRVEQLESARSAAVASWQPRREMVAPGASASPDAPAGSGAAQPSASSTDQDFYALVRQMAESESGRQATIRTGVVVLGRRYPDVAQALGITQEEAQQLYEILARNDVNGGREMLALQSRARQDPEARAEQARLMEQHQQEREREVSALLGGKYEQWKQYQRTAAQRERETQQRQQVQELRAAVSPPGRPVDDARFEALRKALDEEQQRIQAESRGLNMRQELDRIDDNHRRLLDVAASHLDPQQLERYGRHLRLQAEQMRAVAGLTQMIAVSDASD